MIAAVIRHPKCALHSNGSPHHPEAPARLNAIDHHMLTTGVERVCHHYEAKPATKEQLLLVHDAQYIDSVFAAAPHDESMISLDGDTGMNQYSLEAALLGAGAAVQAVDLVMNKTHQHVFCAIRPPGHHAKRGNSAGFCIFNNIAIGAAYALQHHALERIAIVDFDVHHGDGTESIFIHEPKVLFFSSFQHPYYPYSGADTVAPNIFNLPMKAGTGSTEWRAKVSEKWLPALKALQPQLILISAGFDSHQADDMGGFNLVEADYAWITEELCQIAKKYAKGRVVSCLEGGYDLPSLGRSVAAHVNVLAEFS